MADTLKKGDKSESTDSDDLLKREGKSELSGSANPLTRGDFIELEFTGKVQATGKIFDTTSEKIAKGNNIFEEGRKYKPAFACLGSGHLLKGLDKFLEGKEIGSELKASLPPEEAFGQRNPKLMQLTTANKFKEQKLQPVPGMQFVVDGMLATIRSVTGGRVIIDFNHPLAGKALDYEVKVIRKIEDKTEKASALAELILGIDKKDIETSFSEKELKIKFLKPAPPPFVELLKKQIKELIPEASKLEVSTEIIKEELSKEIKQEQAEPLAKTMQEKTESSASEKPTKKKATKSKEKTASEGK